MGKNNTPNERKRGNIALACVIGLIIIIVILVFMGNKNSNEMDSMSTDEAQVKCMLMEEADLVNLMGEEFGDSTTAKAQEYCLSLWDMKKDPKNTVEKFKETVKADWDNRKTEVLEGNTLEEYFEEYKKSIQSR